MKNNVLVLFLALISASLFAGTYSGGSGTSGAPYQIANLNDLQELSTTSADWAEGIYFIQTANIDATATSTWNDGAGMAPIGFGVTIFSGSYDGQGFTINELTINRSGTSYIGMFGYAKFAKLSNIHLANVNITGGSNTGGLAGYFFGSQTSTPNGVITNCSTTGSVISSSSFVGGLVGYVNTYSVIQQCSSTCTVVGATNSGGGLVGLLLTGSKIYNSYAGGTVNSPTYSGGLIGFMNPGSGVAVINCYSYTAVSGTSYKGGFIGRYSSGTINGSFWDTEVSGLANAAGFGSPGGITALTTIAMKTEGNYIAAGWDFVGETVNGTNDYWAMSEGNNNGYSNLAGIFDATWTGNTDTDWNTAGNWSPATIPTAYANITIPAEPLRQPVINQAPASPAVCTNLAIASGAELLIAPGKALTVYGSLTKSANPADLVIESGGSLIHNSNDVAATVKLQITGSSTLTLNKYHFVAIPLTAASLPTSGLFTDSYLYRLDAKKVNPDNENHYGLWVGLGTSPNTALGVDTGYMIYYPGDSKEYAFAGNLNNGSFNAAVLGHDGASSFNLVPNPYPSSINWQAATGWTKTNIENKFWILNNGVYTSFIGGASPDSANGGRRFIVPGQAFVVNATTAAPALRMTNDVRVHSSAGFLKSGSEYPDRLSITATCNSMSDEIVVKMAETATMDYDAGFDVIKLPGSADAPNLSTLAGDQQLCINALPLLSGQTIVPMNFETQFTGQVSFTIGGIGSFDPSINIYLKDELTNQTINLCTQQVYTFVHNTANAANRFKLVFGGTIGIDETPADASKMWIAGNTVYITAPELNSQQALVEVFNPAGQRLLAKSLVLDELTTLVLDLKGFVIVKLTSGQKVITTKGILMK